MEKSVNRPISFHNRVFRVHSSSCLSATEMGAESSSSSSSPSDSPPPPLADGTSSSLIPANETCRAIVSLLINQRKTNLNLEQQLKDLQSTNGQPSKATTSQSPSNPSSPLATKYFSTNPMQPNLHRLNFHQSSIKSSPFDDQQQQQQQRHCLFHNSQHHFLRNSVGQ